MKTRRLKDDFYIENYKTNKFEKVTRVKYSQKKYELLESKKYQITENAKEAQRRGEMNRYQITERLYTAINEETTEMQTWFDCKIKII
jgi:hypothetical protein